MIDTVLKKYERFRPFTESEAWGLFRLAAIAEAVGWTFLIIGILIGRYITPGNDLAVQLAGHVHGMLFLLYIAAAITLYPSQQWTRKRTVIAGLASVPPYGSLLFEQWAAYKRQQLSARQYTILSVYSAIVAVD